MLPNIMNLSSMGAVMPATPLNPGIGGALPGLTPATPNSGTVGFDFNTYLLGLQNKAVEGAVDWEPTFQTTPELKELTPQLPQGTEGDNSASGMSALAALFNLSVPTRESGGNPNSLVELPLPKDTAIPTTQAVDWKALGLTKVSPETLQEQGLDMQKVEKLFAGRSEDLKGLTEKAVEALPGGGKLLALEVQQPAESVKPQTLPKEQPLTVRQPLLQMAEKPVTTEVAQNVKTAPKVETQAFRPPVATETTSISENIPKPELKEKTKTESSLFSAISAPSTTAKNHDTLMTASLTASTLAPNEPAAKSTQAVPEWVTRAETLASQGGGKMTIALSPPELGRVEVDVVTRGKNVEVEMRSENEGARKALESGMSDLKSALLGQDLVLSRSEVKVGGAERSNLDGLTAQNFQQQNQASPERHSQGHSQGQSERQGRWEFANQRVADLSRSPVGRQMSSPAGRIDVRI